MRQRGFILFVVIILTVASSFGQTRFRSGIFLHQSTGLCIWGPNGGQVSVPAEIAKYNLLHGLLGPDSVKMVQNWWPPSSDNEWTTWHTIFDNRDPSNDIRSFLASYPVIMIKSCFPSSNMSGLGTSADTVNPTVKSVANYKWHWRSLVSVMKGRPQNFFIIWTNTPNVAGNTNASEAALSDAFCSWAKDTLAAGLDPIVGTFPENIFVFDFFHLLAGDDGMLPLQLASSSSDSHPNAAATTLVAPQLVKQVFDAALAYESSTTVGDPAAVALSAPSDNATSQPVNLTLRWLSTPGAASYWLRVDTSKTFVSGVRFSDSTLADTAKSFHGLLNNTKFYWHVRAKRAGGAWEFSPTWSFITGSSNTAVRDQNEIPSTFGLDQNYPNPFNPSTKIGFGVSGLGSSWVKLAVYDLLGREVAVLVNEKKEPGSYSVQFNGSRLASGVYLYRIQAGDFVATKRLLLLK